MTVEEKRKELFTTRTHCPTSTDEGNFGNCPYKGKEGCTDCWMETDDEDVLFTYDLMKSEQKIVREETK